MKTTFSSVVLALLLPAYCSAQSEPAVQKAKIQTGIYAEIGHYQPNDGFLGSWDLSLNKPSNQYTLGISLRYRLSARFTLVSGAGLSYKRSKVWSESLLDTTYPWYTPASAGDWNCLPFEQTNLSSYINSFGIDIPLLIQYYPVKNRFFVSTGLELNHTIYEQYKAAYIAYNQDITYINRSEWAKGHQLFLPLSCGLTLPLGQKHTLGIEPGIKLVLESRNKYDIVPGRYTLKTFFYF